MHLWKPGEFSEDERPSLDLPVIDLLQIFRENEQSSWFCAG
jgi:hypothetical protein